MLRSRPNLKQVLEDSDGLGVVKVRVGVALVGGVQHQRRSQRRGQVLRRHLVPLGDRHHHGQMVEQEDESSAVGAGQAVQDAEHQLGISFGIIW